MEADKIWWYAVGTERKGPVSTEELQSLVLRGELASLVSIWREGMPYWQPLADTEDGAALLAKLPPPLALAALEPESSTPTSASSAISSDAAATGPDGYLLDHWHGRHSLSRSVLLNTMLPSLLLLCAGYFTQTSTFDYGGGGVVVALLLASVLLGCWQYMGIRRSARRMAVEHKNKRALALAVEWWPVISLLGAMYLVIGALHTTGGLWGSVRYRTADDLTQHPAYYVALRHAEDEGASMSLHEEWVYLKPASDAARTNLIASAAGTSLGLSPALLFGPWSTFAAVAMSRLGQRDLLAYADEMDAENAESQATLDAATEAAARQVDRDAATQAAKNQAVRDAAADAAADVAAHQAGLDAAAEAATREAARDAAVALEADRVAIAAAHHSEELRRSSPMQDLGGGALRDPMTNLEWTQSDNGSDIDWDSARQWCAQKGAGWRLPSVEELGGIHDASGTDSTACAGRDCMVSSLFRLSSMHSWSGEAYRSVRALSVYLGDKETVFRLDMTESKHQRALCVRSSGARTG